MLSVQLTGRPWVRPAAMTVNTGEVHHGNQHGTESTTTVESTSHLGPILCVKLRA